MWKRIKQLATSKRVEITPEKMALQEKTINIYTRTDMQDTIKDLLLRADKIAKNDPQGVVLLLNPHPKPVFALAVGKELSYDVLVLAKTVSKVLQGGAGSVDKHLAQGGGQDPSKIPEAIEILRQQL